MVTENKSELSIDSFNYNVAETAPPIRTEAIAPKRATASPYTTVSTPKDIYSYLAPSGEAFSLFGDPYAQLVFLPTQINTARKGRWWYDVRSQENDYTEREIALLMFLGSHRCATRSQIARGAFNEAPDSVRIRDFLRKSVENGVIAAFTWVSPCKDERNHPHVYGLTPMGYYALRDLTNNQKFVPKTFQFLPTNFPTGKNPSMRPYFSILIANEFYCQLNALDRIIEWTYYEKLVLSNSKEFTPTISTRLIRDAQDYRYVWIEIFRVSRNWVEGLVKRFREIQEAYTHLAEEQRPESVFLIVDDISRIPDISSIAEQFSPDIPLRFTSDHVIVGNSHREPLFHTYSDVERVVQTKAIRFLKNDWTGMKASEYFQSFIPDETALWEDSDY